MNIAIITAGGVGKRFGGDVPKQFVKDCTGTSIIMYTISIFQECKDIDKICLVCLERYMDIMRDEIQKRDFNKVQWIVAGGVNAQESRWNGLKAIKANKDDIIIIHDGVRPFISKDTISKGIESCKKYGCTATGVKVNAAILKNNENKVNHMDIEYPNTIIAQMPYFANFDILYNSYLNGNINTTVGPSDIIDKNIDQYIIYISQIESIKITTRDDLKLLSILL